MKNKSAILILALSLSASLSVTASSFERKPVTESVSKKGVIVIEDISTVCPVSYIEFRTIENFSDTVVLFDSSVNYVFGKPNSEAVLAITYVKSFEREGYVVRHNSKLPSTFADTKNKLWLLHCNIRQC